MDHEEPATLVFDRFRLVTAQRRLYRDDASIHLGGRAMDLLITLAERAGEVVSRSELEARAWPRVLVKDSSLRVHIAALRKTLGDGTGDRRFIANVPGRGYAFVGDVERVALSGKP